MVCGAYPSLFNLCGGVGRWQRMTEQGWVLLLGNKELVCRAYSTLVDDEIVCGRSFVHGITCRVG